MDPILIIAIVAALALLAMAGGVVVLVVILLAVSSSRKKRQALDANTTEEELVPQEIVSTFDVPSSLEEIESETLLAAESADMIGSVMIDNEYEAEAGCERLTVDDTPPIHRVLVRRLEQITAQRQGHRPLPMPVPPPDLEPIPELEPTEIMLERPDWARDWPLERT